MNKIAASLCMIFALCLFSTPAQAGDIDGLHFENIGMRVVKKSGDFVYISWQVKLENSAEDSFDSITVEYQFLDSDGYVLKYSLETTSLGSHESQIVRGQTMVLIDVSERISDTVVKVTAIR